MKIKRRCVIIYLLIIMVIPSVFPIQSKENDSWNNSVEQKLWGLMKVWAEVKSNFVYFDQVPDLDWDLHVKKAISDIISTGNRDDYYKMLQRLITRLHDGHTYVQSPDGMVFFLTGQYSPPLELQMIEKKILITRVELSDEIKNQHIVPGFEIVAIDKIPVKSYFSQKIVPYCSASTLQARESFGLLMLLDGKKNTTLQLTLMNRKGKSRNVTLTRTINYFLGPTFRHRIFHFTPLVKQKWLNDGIVYFNFSTFYSPLIVNEFFDALNKLDMNKIKGMIIDVRFNSGGNNENAHKIISRLISKPVQTSKWKTRKYLPAYRSWGKPEKWYEAEPGIIKPAAEKKYNGPLIILTGPFTNSAAEDFIIPLKFSKRAILVGEKTAGSTGNPVVCPLPGGGKLYVCSKRDTYPDGREFVGFGIQPDISVQVSQQDIINNFDPVLNRAKKILKNWKKD